MSMLGNKIYCRWPKNIYDRKKQKEMGFHRCSKECFYTKAEALRAADRIGCGIFYCKLAGAWHLGKGTVNY